MRRAYLLLILGILLLPATARSDIAPTTYAGRTLAPIKHTEIRMDSEFVEITLGPRVSDEGYNYKAHVSARFRMVNDVGENLAVKVGFPVAGGSLESFHEAGVYKFRVSINGGAPFSPDTSIVSGAYTYDRRSRHLWFGWATVFPPGPTVVVVDYDVVSSYSYAQGLQNLYYTIHTGRFWKDAIGYATIRVVFPQAIQAGMIMQEAAARWLS